VVNARHRGNHRDRHPPRTAHLSDVVSD
jgi:hypothetical protein